MAVPVDAVDAVEGTQIAGPGMIAQVVVERGELTGPPVEAPELAREGADPEHTFPVLVDRRNGPEHGFKPVGRSGRAEADEFLPLPIEFGNAPLNVAQPKGELK